MSHFRTLPFGTLLTPHVLRRNIQIIMFTELFECCSVTVSSEACMWISPSLLSICSAIDSHNNKLFVFLLFVWKPDKQQWCLAGCPATTVQEHSIRAWSLIETTHSRLAPFEKWSIHRVNCHLGTRRRRFAATRVPVVEHASACTSIRQQWALWNGNDIVWKSCSAEPAHHQALVGVDEKGGAAVKAAEQNWKSFLVCVALITTETTWFLKKMIVFLSLKGCALELIISILPAVGINLWSKTKQQFLSRFCHLKTNFQYFKAVQKYFIHIKQVVSKLSSRIEVIMAWQT